MVTLEKLRERVRSRVATAASCWGEYEEDIVLASVLELGLHVAKDGEIYNPAPVGPPLVRVPDMNRFRFSRKRR